MMPLSASLPSAISCALSPATAWRLAANPCSDIMTAKLITGTPEDSVKHVMQVMTNKRIRHFPVYKDGKLAGLVSIGDVVRHRLQDLELEKNVLRDAYIAAR